jgi:hypothetical protein
MNSLLYNIFTVKGSYRGKIKMGIFLLFNFKPGQQNEFPLIPVLNKWIEQRQKDK